jgi:hypothetical protein
MDGSKRTRSQCAHWCPLTVGWWCASFSSAAPRDHDLFHIHAHGELYVHQLDDVHAESRRAHVALYILWISRTRH